MFEKFADKINKKLRTEDDEEITFKPAEPEEVYAPERTEDAPQNHGLNVSVDDRESEGGIKFKVVRPESFEEVSKIADHLIDGCTVVLNTENLEPAACIRMLDFLNGVTYTTEGYINAVAKNTYIITPSDVDVSGDEE